LVLLISTLFPYTTLFRSGRYSLDVPDNTTILVFSFVGYATQEVNIAGRTVVDVSMVQDVRSLDEVVVTALGLEKSTRSLGYATRSEEHTSELQSRENLVC